MRALSLWRPWAELIAERRKLIETRRWRMVPTFLLGQRLAIHAATRLDEGAIARIFGETGRDVSGVEISPGGCIVCHARVHAVTWLEDTPHERMRALCECDGLVGIHLTDIRPLRPPRLFRGRQGVFNVPDDLRSLEPCRV